MSFWRPGKGSITFLISGAMLCGFLYTMHWLRDAVPPSPYDISRNQDRSVEIVESNLKLFWTRTRSEIGMRRMKTEAANALFVEYAADQAELIDEKQLADGELYRYGEILRSAHQWEKALKAFQKYRKSSPNMPEDFRVNTLLRMAHCNAALGNVESAISETRETFTAPRNAKAPILLAVYLEIVPAMQTSGAPSELAHLVKDAIIQHEMTLVNPRSEAGHNFLLAKPHHLRRAWTLIVELATEAGDLSLASEAMLRSGAIPNPSATP